MMSSEHHFIRAAPIDRRARRALKVYGLIGAVGLSVIALTGLAMIGVMTLNIGAVFG